MNKKYNLSFHVIFIMNENIKWVEEFILYHSNLGFEHFYLYDNEGSTGGDGTKTHNKYGFEIDNDVSYHDKFQNILAKYGNMITYVKWQPRNEKGEIIYGQDDGIRHFMKNYGNETEWVALMDLDEFLFSEQDVNIADFFRNQPRNISCVKIVQKKFIDRFLSHKTFITQDYQCIDKKIGYDWAPKNIVRTSDFIDITNIHGIKVKHDTLEPDPAILRFNHYNVNDKLISWMNDFYNSDTSFQINSIDNGMQRYSHLFEPQQNDYSIIATSIFILFLLCFLYYFWGTSIGQKISAFSLGFKFPRTINLLQKKPFK